jgi:hypothetical protein
MCRLAGRRAGHHELKSKRHTPFDHLRIVLVKHVAGASPLTPPSFLVVHIPPSRLGSRIRVRKRIRGGAVCV